MSFETITAFLAMGGYATYVFASYGLTGLTLLGLLLTEARRHRSWLRRQHLVQGKAKLDLCNWVS